MIAGLLLASTLLLQAIVSVLPSKFPLSGPTTPQDAVTCYTRLSTNHTQDQCLTSSESKWKVTVNLTQLPLSHQTCHAWADTVMCINKAVCEHCSKSEAFHISDWETDIANQSACPHVLGQIKWCQVPSWAASTERKATRKTAKRAVVYLVVAILVVLLLLGGTCILMLFNSEQEKIELKKPSDESNSIQAGLTTKPELPTKSNAPVAKSNVNSATSITKSQVKLPVASNKVSASSKSDCKA